ncbi:MAG: MBL fold metallo-hydrolase [bacterium]|nr:MBL fold metallo-hydrolase [bacterium]
MITIGPYKVDVLETGRFALDGGAMFGVVPKPLWERAYTHADMRNRIPMAAKALLLRSEERTIVVDTGNSPFMHTKLLDIYGIDFGTYTIEQSLHALGVRAEDVTDVILTHLHFDHVGGAIVKNAAGESVPRFPNAWYHVQKEHFDWASAPTEKDRASFMPEMYLPLIEHGRLEFLDGPGELFPMVHVDLAFGHTAALQTVRVSDGANTVYYPADLMPTGAHIGIAYGMGYDNFPLTTMAEKKKILPVIVDEQWLVVFEHDALRQSATVVMGDRGPMLGPEVSITDAP